MSIDGDVGALDIVGICGSLRKDSFNRSLLAALKDVETFDAPIEILADWAEVPVFNQDLMAHDDDLPPPVRAISDRIRRADAVVVATPEYCLSIPGPLKNLLDWMSFPPPENPLRHKPIAVMGASIGPGGTTRAQTVLRSSLWFFDAVVMGKPEVAVSLCTTKFDASGKLTDEPTKALLRRYYADFVEFAASTKARNLAALGREFIF